MVGLISLVLVLIALPMLSATTLGSFQKDNYIELPQIANSTYCNITSIKYPNSTKIGLTYPIEMTKTGVDYTHILSKDYTSNIGVYIVNGECDTVAWAYDFEITSTGEKVSLSNIVIVFAFLFVGAILFILGYTFEKERWILKTSFYIFALFMGLLAINSANIIASESSRLSQMSSVGLITIITIIGFLVLYLFINWTIQTFKQIKEKDEIRWKY
jgi:hypothetical protein